MPHLITCVAPDSIAGEMEISPGDFLLSVNGKKIADVLDYRYLTREENVLLEIEKPGGEVWELEIEKDEDEDLGLEFEKALMDDAKHCKNKCAFCFIDQLPAGMRGTLYFKDDDPRLSFLSGNYVTLTNITREEAERIAFYHLSPMRISVHAIEPELRVKVMGNPGADKLGETLELFNNAGITMHFQVVLCRGLNDGGHLDRTIGGLMKYRPGAASLSVVPAGLTKHREGLYPLEPFTREEAAQVVAQIQKWQGQCLRETGSAFVFCADELYLQAGMPLPEYEHYGDFPQLENGVGMLALFKKEFEDAAGERLASRGSKDGSTSISISIGVITGKAAGGFMRELTRAFENVTVLAVENNFFGPLITVSGLLTGVDVIAQIKDRVSENNIDVLLMPRNAFRAGTEQMLDGVTLEELREKLGVPVIVSPVDGGEFYRLICFSQNSTNISTFSGHLLH